MFVSSKLSFGSDFVGGYLGFLQSFSFGLVAIAFLSPALADETLITTDEVYALLDTGDFRTLDARPNFGTLYRVPGTTRPDSGGTWFDVTVMCGTYAPMVEDPKDFSSELCMLFAAMQLVHDFKHRVRLAHSFETHRGALLD